jgi:hypothetical protein
LRSIAIDKDLNFSNEYEYFRTQNLGNVLDPDSKTITGLPPNPWPIGNAVFWSPFFLMAHNIEKWSGGSADGYSKTYINLVTTGTLVYSFLVLVLIYLLLAKIFKEEIAFTATAIIFLSTSLMYYTFIDPSVSHALSAFTATLFLYYWYSTRKKRNLFQSIALGFFAGIMVITRWQDSLFLLVIIYDLRRIFPLKTKSSNRTLYGPALFFITLILTFIPQMIFWKIVYGSYLLIPQYQGFVLWYPKYLLQVLFSPVHGLFTWTPIIFISVIGLILYQKEAINRKSILPVLLLLILLLQIFANSSIYDWNGSWSFGSRRFVSCSVIFAFGIAHLITLLSRRFTMKTITLFFLAFIIWNILLITQAYFNHSIIDPAYPFIRLIKDQAALAPKRFIELFSMKMIEPLFFFRKI